MSLTWPEIKKTIWDMLGHNLSFVPGFFLKLDFDAHPVVCFAILGDSTSENLPMYMCLRQVRPNAP